MEEQRAKKQVELLAPAGSYQAFQAALLAGADAVYAGGGFFGARAFAKNFTEEELLRAIDEAHLQGVRLYLTVNTLCKEQEVSERLYDYLLPLYRQGLDGVIVQDIGVIAFVQKHFPKLPIHASTQMNLCSLQGVQTLEKLGVKRVVLARELSLKEVEYIARHTSMEIECFVHGAMCVSYSGQCLYSSFLGGRSGNRGQCAQPCRLPYRKEGQEKDQYWLSMKDLSAVRLIPKLLECGVSSLKIEGRMKSEEYVYQTVSLYRKYIDRFLDGKNEIDKEDRKRLQTGYTRGGGGTGYYERQNGKEMLSLFRSGYRIGTGNKTIPVKTTRSEKLQSISVQGILFLSAKQPATLQLQVNLEDVFLRRKGFGKWNGKEKVTVTVAGEKPVQADKQPLSKERIRKQLQKTGGTGFVLEALVVEMDEPLFLTIGQLNELRRRGLRALYEELFRPWRREVPVVQGKQQEDEKRAGSIVRDGKQEKMKFSVLVSKEEQLREVLLQTQVKRIYLEGACYGKWEALGLQKISAEAKAQGKELYLALPHVFRKATVDAYRKRFLQIDSCFDGILLRNYDSLGFLEEMAYKKPMITDSALYRWNWESNRQWEKLGASAGTYPLELQKQELFALNEEKQELIVYGYLPMMITAQCIRKTAGECTKQSGITKMIDRMNSQFIVANYCEDCYNIVYNSVPLSLYHQQAEVKQLQPVGLRLEFTVESAQKTRSLLEKFLKAYEERSAAGKLPLRYTKGHWGKGVT